MSQSRRRSLLEACANIAIGCSISWTATMLVLPAYGYPVTASHAGGMTLIFTGISLVRSYTLRRVFNRGERHPT
ncbi:MAG: DUF7220 family protein [Planctomycetota bacterium]